MSDLQLKRNLELIRVLVTIWHYYMALSAKKGFLTETEEKTVDRHDRYIGESDYSQVTEWLKTHYVYWRTPCFYTVPK